MVTGSETAIVRAGDLSTPRSRALMPAMTIGQAVDRFNAVLEFTKTVFKPNVDFGIIPGTKAKPTLLKPGAEKLCSLFGLVPDFEEMRILEDWTVGRFYYCYKCVLYNIDGVRLGAGIGSCNSLEKKYRWRNAQMQCPNCGKTTIIRSKYPPRDRPEQPPGFVCLTKSGGCGFEYDLGDDLINKQSTGKVANDEPFELINTLQKMAQKRALVAAALVVTNASEFFTQDLEDQNYIDADWTPADTAAAAPRNGNGDGHAGQDDVDTFKTRGGEPDLSHDATFVECWKRAARERKIDAEKAVRWLEFALSKSPKGSAKNVRQLRIDDRAKHLAALADGHYDDMILQKPADNKPADPPAADAKNAKRDKWPDFMSTLYFRADELKVQRATVADVVAARALALGIVGREWEMPATDRGQIYDDLDRLQGPFEVKAKR